MSVSSSFAVYGVVALGVVLRLSTAGHSYSGG